MCDEFEYTSPYKLRINLRHGGPEGQMMVYLQTMGGKVGTPHFTTFLQYVDDIEIIDEREWMEAS